MVAGNRKEIGIVRETPRPHNTSVDLLKYSLPLLLQTTPQVGVTTDSN
jgi:hypothetical protein